MKYQTFFAQGMSQCGKCNKMVYFLEHGWCRKCVETYRPQTEEKA